MDFSYIDGLSDQFIQELYDDVSDETEYTSLSDRSENFSFYKSYRVFYEYIMGKFSLYYGPHRCYNNCSSLNGLHRWSMSTVYTVPSGSNVKAYFTLYCQCNR